MSESAPARSSGPASPAAFRASAVVVLVRGDGAKREVFWVRRSEAVPYMPGFHAFVGGGVNAADAAFAGSMRPSGDSDALGADGFDAESLRTLEACAIRETFEETGVLLGAEASPDRRALEAARGEVLAGGKPFDRAASERRWRFRSGTVRYIGRWTTPPFATARFDSAFFLAQVPAGQTPSIVPGELASGEWIEAAVALARWKRGEATFAAPILHVLLELERAAEEEVDAFAPQVIERMREAPRRAGEPVRRIELKWGIVLHPIRTRPLPPATHTNAYLVGERAMALIDPGSADPAELESLFGVIEALAADGRTLACILATHDHPDHVAGVEAARARYRVPVLAHAASNLPADRRLAGGELVPLASAERDWTLRAIHTPGHARGHLCFHHAGTRSLFSGDHITGGTGTVIIDPPEGDMGDYIASLEKLLAEPIDTLFPGHGSPQGAAHRRIRGLIAHRLEREAKVLAALDDTPRAPAELVERAYTDTPRELWRYAERSLLAHLLKLERERKAVREGERWGRATT